MAVLIRLDSSTFNMSQFFCCCFVVIVVDVFVCLFFDCLFFSVSDQENVATVITEIAAILESVTKFVPWSHKDGTACCLKKTDDPDPMVCDH